MADNDQAVLNMIKQLIKEVKEDMKVKKVLAEGKTPQDVFKHHEKELKRYIIENVMNTLQESEK
jgi:hypothetical protein